MIVGAVSCPQPPLLLPGMTGRPVPEVEELRTACLAAIDELLAAGPDRLVLAAGDGNLWHGNLWHGNLWHSNLWHSDGTGPQPLGLLVGRVLLAEAGCRLPVRELAVGADWSASCCVRAGEQLVTESAGGRTGLLVMADGSARRTVKAPGYLDERAVPFDASIGAALAAGDAAALAALDADVAGELLVAGRSAWQLLAGVISASGAPDDGAGTNGRARLRYAADPFGVWYPVADWYPG